MPNRPNATTLSASSVDILNAIRNNASADYRNYIPQADGSLENIREIGAIMMNYQALQNEFLNALVNRIGRVIISSKSYTNPWSEFKKGMLEYGETIEDIFVNIAKPFEYNIETAENEVFKREIPDVRAAFYTLNYQKFYKTTVQREQLRQAFLSLDGVTDLITKIIDSMYTGAEYDEFQVMKYMLAKQIISGQLNAVSVSAITNEATAKQAVSKIKGISNNFEFMSSKYNRAAVHTYSKKEDQYLIMNADIDALIDVEVLAASFNMTKAEFMGHRVLIDGFGELDVDRLDQLFAETENYAQFTVAELEALNAIPAVIVDKDWFMIFDNMVNFTEQFNGQGLYWNYWYHVWKTFSVSPYANNTVFVPGTPAVTSVTVSPSAVTASAGQTVKLGVEVATNYFAPQTVEWSVDDDDLASVDIYGNVSIKDDATGTVTVTATSTFDSSVSDTCVITIA